MMNSKIENDREKIWEEIERVRKEEERREKENRERLKEILEMNAKKEYTCPYCGQKNGHHTVNCPVATGGR